VNNEKNITEKALRYIHGEMSEAELREFEAILRTNPELQKSVAEDRLIFENLKPLRGVPVGQWDKLADHILEEMDRGSARIMTPESESSGQILPFPVVGATDRRRRRRRFTSVVLALAALFLLFLVPRWMLSPLVWQAPLIDQSSALREAGDKETTFQRYTDEDFNKAFSKFQESMDRAYRRSHFSLLPRREWQLSTSIREMRAGRVAVSVVAVHPKQAGITKEWTEYYRNLDAWVNDSDALSRRIAGELGELNDRD
jgi:anti-sigma factor RsiW